MQATVHRFDVATGSGAVVTDAGVLLPFDAQAFAATRMRHLRPGQRLTVTLAPDGSRVVAMNLGSVGRPPARPSRP